MEAIIDGYLMLASSNNEGLEVGDGVGHMERGGNAVIELARRMEEVVVGVCDDDCSVGGHGELNYWPEIGDAVKELRVVDMGWGEEEGSLRSFISGRGCLSQIRIAQASSKRLIRHEPDHGRM